MLMINLISEMAVVNSLAFNVQLYFGDQVNSILLWTGM